MKWLVFTAATKRIANVVGDNKQYVNEKEEALLRKGYHQRRKGTLWHIFVHKEMEKTIEFPSQYYVL